MNRTGRDPIARMRVLACYDAYPDIGTAELAKLLGMNASNISACRKWLMEKGFMESVRVGGVRGERGVHTVSYTTETGLQWLLGCLRLDNNAYNTGLFSPNQDCTYREGVTLLDVVTDYHTEKARRSLQQLQKNRDIKKHYVESGEWANACVLCGLGPEWEGKALTLELDHINGDPHNNSRENLRLLCPNCHSQTPTHRGRNRGKGRGRDFQEGSTMRINSPLEEIPKNLAPRTQEPRPQDSFLHAFSTRFEKAYGARYTPGGEDRRHAKNIVRDFAPELLNLMLDTFFGMDMFRVRELPMPPIRRFWYLRDELLESANAKLQEREHQAAETLEDREAIRRARKEQEELYAKLEQR